MAEHGEQPQPSETAARRNGSEGQATDAAATAAGRASEALSRLRVVIDQAAQSIRELAAASEEWTGTAGADLRRHGERAVGTVSRQVEEYPLTSLAVAFTVGYLCGALLTRR